MHRMTISPFELHGAPDAPVTSIKLLIVVFVFDSAAEEMNTEEVCHAGQCCRAQLYLDLVAHFR